MIKPTKTVTISCNIRWAQDKGWDGGRARTCVKCRRCDDIHPDSGLRREPFGLFLCISTCIAPPPPATPTYATPPSPLACPNFCRFAFCTGCDRADRATREGGREMRVVAFRINRRRHVNVGTRLLDLICS